MILSHAHRFIFIKTVKTAGTSLEVALSQLCGPSDVVTPFGRPEPGHQARNHTGYTNHMSAKALREKIGATMWSDYFSFAVERNPWDKVVSHYWFLKGQNEFTGPFPAFVEQAATSPLGRIALPFGRQLYMIDGEIAVEHIARYEQLDQELEMIGQRIGAAIPPLPRAKSAYRDDPRHFSDYYDATTAGLVASAFAFEIETFGYSLKDQKA